MSIQTLCVFCGAKGGTNPEMVQLASGIGREIANRKISIVYGGSNCGMMGAVTDSALSVGGKVIGVFPDLLTEAQPPHMGLTDLIRTPCLATRKQKMIDISDGFLILPGGYGTLDEIFEIVVLRKLKAHNKPMILLNYKGFWNNTLEQIRTMIREGFIDVQDGYPFVLAENLEEFTDALTGVRPLEPLVALSTAK